MQQRPPLHLYLRDYAPHERVTALAKAALYESEEGPGDAVLVLLQALRKVIWCLGSAKYRGNVGTEMHQLAVATMQSTIRLVATKPPHRVTHFPVQRRA